MPVSDSVVDEAVDARRRNAALRRPFRLTDYRWLFSALAVSQIGDFLYSVALAVYLYDRTGSAGWVAGAYAARLLPAILLAPYAGVLADRWPRRRVMLVSDLVSAGLVIALTLVAALDGPLLVAVLIPACVSASATFFLPAMQAVLPEVVDEDDLAAANTLTSLVENIALVGGPALGVLVLAATDAWVAFAVDAATFVAGAVLLTRMHTHDSPPSAHTETGGLVSRLSRGAAALRDSPLARGVVGIAALANLLYGSDTVLFVLVAAQRLGTGSAGTGYLLAALGAGGIAVATVANRAAGSPKAAGIILLSMTLYCLPLAGLALTRSPVVAVGLLVVRGAGFVVVDVLAITVLQRVVPSDVLARVFGLVASVVVAGIAIGALIVPPLVAATGLTATLLILGLAPVALTAAAYPALRRTDRTTADRAVQLAPVIARLRTVEPFAAASRPALEQLAAAVQQQTVDAGTPVVRQGDVADAFYVVVVGRLTVESTGETGGPAQPLGDLGPGDWFGELGLLGKVPRTATVIATTNCVLDQIPGTDFLDGVTGRVASPALFERATARLARTHPSARLDVDPAAGGGKQQ